MRYPRHLPSAIRALLLLVIAAACFNVAPAAHAQTAAPAVHSIHIDAGPLAKALDALGAQTGVSIVYAPDLVAGLDAQAVSGDLTPAAALRQTLKGTGLSFSSPGPAIFVLHRAEKAEAPARVGSATPPASQSERAQKLGEITVVGSRLASQYKSAQPVVRITHEEIERSGASSIAGVLAQLPEVSVLNIGNNVETGGDFNATTVQLRGMPAGETLVLVNGRRIGNTGPQAALGFFNLSTLPLALVDHIEILPVGSSAIYGGDALAGVVNIVLKKNASGLAITLTKAHADGYIEDKINLTWGHSWSRGSLTIAGSYRDNSGLYQSERAITANKDYRRFGGYDGRSTLTNPGNVFSLEGCPPAPSYCYVPVDERGDLPGLDAPYAAVPAGSTGENLTPADFAATAGTFNKTSLTYPIFLPSKHYGAMVRGNFELTPQVDLFTTLVYSHNEIHRAGTPVLLYGKYGGYRVPASNPYNPFGEEVGVSFALPGRPDATLGSDYLRTLLGARGQFGTWDWEMSVWQSRDTADQVNYLNTTESIRNALASSDPATALNPFEDGPGGSPQLIASFFNREFTPYTVKLQHANGFIRGPLAQLPAGPVRALIGAEYQRQVLSNSSVYGESTDGSRSNRAVFTELRVPLLASDDPNGAPLLNLHAALRADRNSGFEGTGVTKTFGIEYRPWNTLLVRATWNTAFKPPILYESSLEAQRYFTNVEDPKHGNESVPALITTNGVPDTIKPERGTSTTFGIVYSPTTVPLNFSVSWWRNHVNDRINGIDPQYLLDHEDVYSNRIIRNAGGALVAIDDREVNVNYIKVAGVDFDMSGHWATPFGIFFPSLAATMTYHYETQVNPHIPPVNGVSRGQASGFAPRWKGLARMGWQTGNLYAQLSGRYISEYRDYYPLQNGEYGHLGDFWLFDISLSYDVGQALAPDSSWLSGTTVRLSALNVFNRKPDYSRFTGSGYDPAQYDIRGRYATLSVEFNF